VREGRKVALARNPALLIRWRKRRCSEGSTRSSVSLTRRPSPRARMFGGAGEVHGILEPFDLRSKTFGECRRGCPAQIAMDACRVACRSLNVADRAIIVFYLETPSDEFLADVDHIAE
jgi:hypothetical protein